MAYKTILHQHKKYIQKVHTSTMNNLKVYSSVYNYAKPVLNGTKTGWHTLYFISKEYIKAIKGTRGKRSVFLRLSFFCGNNVWINNNNLGI